MGEDLGYQPVACDFHDQLEAFAVTRRRVRISHAPDNLPEKDLPEIRHEGLIKDIYTTDRKEEFLLMEDGTAIRLDRIKAVETII
jgi:transcriptional antiterminator Rof (Rho-off)